MTDRKIFQMVTAGLLVLIGVVGRIYLRPFLPSLPSMHLTINGITQPIFIADMFFIVALVSLASGILLRGYYTIIIPVAVMMITDVFMGNSYVFLFTWSGFAFIALMAYTFSRTTLRSSQSVIKIMGIGIGSILIYDLWTNFGWWLGPYFPHTLDGLLLCYTLAIPFMIWHLVSTSILLLTISFPLVYFANHSLRLEARRPLEHYVPVCATLFLATTSLLFIVL
jgi:hypothetical protein